MTDSNSSKDPEADFPMSEPNDENRLIVEAKISYADLDVLTDLGEGKLF
jgi:hypothetical protein